MLTIDYDHDGFSAGVLASHDRQLDVTWDEILWAAITVGRPDLYHVFKYGNASLYEAVLRWSMIRMALEQRGPRGTRLYRTDAFKRMDPTEKGAVNYFLGLVFCKLFAAKKIDAPWSLHLDVWRNVLTPTLLSGRSRPDMVAQSGSSGAWYAFECKGRASTPGLAEKQRAKAQANRLVRVGRTNCTLHIGAITYYRNDTLQFYWRDPEPTAPDPIKVPRPQSEWREYYLPFIDAYRFYGGGDIEQPVADSAAVKVQELDITLIMHPSIAEFLLAGDWNRARTVAREMRDELEANGYRPDGLLVKAGNSWQLHSEDRIGLH